MTTPQLGNISEVVDGLAGTTALRDITWQLKIATVMSFSGAAVMGQFDGDGVNGEPFQPVPMISLVDTLAVGDRVAVISVPPSGNYIIRNGSSGSVANTESVYASPDNDSRNVGGFFDLLIGGAPFACTFTKKYDATKLEIHHTMQGYVGTGNTIMLAALNINGNDYATARLFFNDSGKHLSFSADTVIPRVGEADIPAGTYDIVARYGRESGAGTINVDNNDRVSFTVTEVTAT